MRWEAGSLSAGWEFSSAYQAPKRHTPVISTRRQPLRYTRLQAMGFAVNRPRADNSYRTFAGEIRREL
jgi:hypothetical protein